MVSDCLKSSKICSISLAVFSNSLIFPCLADRLTKAITYRNAMASECIKSSKICLIALAVSKRSSTFLCSNDKLTKAIA